MAGNEKYIFESDNKAWLSSKEKNILNKLSKNPDRLNHILEKIPTKKLEQSLKALEKEKENFPNKNNEKIMEKFDKAIKCIENILNWKNLTPEKFQKRFENNEKLRNFCLSKIPYFDFWKIKTIKEIFPNLTIQDAKLSLNENILANIIWLKKIKKIDNNLNDIKQIWKENLMLSYGIYIILQFKESKKNINIAVGLFNKLKDKVLNFSILEEVKETFPDLSIKDILYFFDKNADFNLHWLKKIKEVFPNLTIKDIKNILDKKNDLDFDNIALIWASMKKSNKNINIYDVIKKYNEIIKNDPEFNFFKFAFISEFTNNINEAIDTYYFIKNKNPEFAFFELENVKQLFPKLTAKDIKYILIKKPKFDIFNLQKLKVIFHKLTTKDIRYIFSENPQFNTNELSIIWLFEKNIHKAIKIYNSIKTKKPKFNFSYLKQAKKSLPSLNIKDIWYINDILSIVRTWQDNKGEIFKDPAIKNMLKILKWKFFENLDMETKLILARNLYFKNKEVNEQNLQKEYKKLLENREKYKNLELFKWRNVVFTAHEENLKKEYQSKEVWKERFAKEDTIAAIKKQWWKIKVIHPDNTQEQLKKAKQDTLKALENTHYPMTFIFNWHGWPNEIYLSDWKYIWSKNASIKEKENTIKITVDEIAQALIKRTQNKNLDHNKNNIKNKDILIFESCYNHTFIRNLYNKLNKYNQKAKKKWLPIVNLPITIWESEYNQLWYSNFRSKYWSDFNEKVLNLKNKNTITTIWTVLKNQDKLEDSNPSVYIPNNHNTQIQLWENDISKKNEIVV